MNSRLPHRPSRSPRRRIRRPRDWAAALAVLSALACSETRGSSNEDVASTPRSVHTVAVVAATGSKAFTFGGEVVAVNRVEVSSKVTGTIVELPVTEGTRVSAGELLARVDVPEYEAALIQARADEAQAKTAADTATRHAERYRRLEADGVVAPRDLELAELSRASAVAQHDGARARLSLAERNLSYAAIRAPAGGSVVERRVRAGDLATPGRPLVVLDDGDREIVVTIPVGVSARSAAGDDVLVISGIGVESVGVVNRVVPDVSRRTRRLFVRVPEWTLPTGSFVDVRFAGADSISRLPIPPGALRRRDSLASVFVVEGGRAVLRYVRLDEEGNAVAGLHDGDRVIVRPPSDLRDGDPITDAGLPT